MELNLNQPDFFQDPYPYYARIRAAGKPFWLPHAQKTTSNGLWLFSRYADALTIFKEVTAVSKNIRSVRTPGASTPFDLIMLHRDAPDHLRLRRLVADYFSAQYLDQLETHIALVADALIRELQGKTRVDLLADFAEQLPLRVIAHLMGVPVSDLPQIRAWSLVLADGFDSVLASDEVLLNHKSALLAFLSYVEQLIAVKRRAPADDLLGFLANAEAEGKIQRDELIGMVGFLVFAGHETIINLIGNGLWLLLSHPEQWALLQEQPELMSGAVEEILRFESPEQRTTFRIAVEPMELAGMRLEPGQQLGIIIGAANRDETEFPDPDRFDIRRTPNSHLAFGVGLHNCLGKTLARLEARIALGRMLALCPALHLLNEQPQWRRNSFMRGLEALPATLG